MVKNFQQKYVDGVDFFSVPVVLSQGEIRSFVNPFEELTVTKEEKSWLKLH